MTLVILRKTFYTTQMPNPETPSPHGSARQLQNLCINSILVGVGIGMTLPLSLGIVSESVPPADRGFTIGIRLMGNRLAQFFNPLFFGLLAQFFGLAVPFFAGGVLLFGVTVPIFVLWYQRIRKGPA